jgi:hypothetical protein
VARFAQTVTMVSMYLSSVPGTKKDSSREGLARFLPRPFLVSRLRQYAHRALRCIDPSAWRRYGTEHVVLIRYSGGAIGKII